MDDSFVLGLIQNIALLLAFSMIYDYFWARKETKDNVFYQIASGIILGGIGIVLILTPWTLRAGLIFDTRSVLLSISGLFLGPIPTLIGMIIISTYRIMLGGTGMWMGIAVILSSGSIGILWHHFRPAWRKKSPVLELIVLGLIVHIVMLCCTFFLPDEIIWETIQNIALPVILLYPLATVLLGILMIRQSRNWENKKALDISEERWHFALEGAGDGLWDWNMKTNEIYFSNRWKEMLGYDPDEIENKFEEWDIRIHPDDRTEVYETVNRFLKREVEIYESEHRLLCKNGTYKWILARGKVMIWDDCGNPVRSIGTHKDISDRKEKEMQLAYEKYLVEALMNYTPESIFFKDLDSKFIRVNKASAIILGCSDPSQAIGKSDFDFFSEEYATKTYKDEQKIIKTGKPYYEEGNGVIIDGVETWTLTNKMPLQNPEGKIIGTYGFSIDITERKKVEQALKDSQEQLKKFAAHLQNIREEERVLLAREIHDELGQILVALKIDLGILKHKMVKISGAQTDVEIKFEQVLKLLDNTIKTTRKIMTGLRPEVLELVGFIEAARLYAIEFQERHKINCLFECDLLSSNIDSQKSVALFRILQEALTNVAKHAKATEVIIKLLIENGNMVMEIADNGIGIDVTKKNRNDSYGLIGMRERVLLLDGELTITGQPEKGTTIRVEMAYNE